MQTPTYASVTRNLDLATTEKIRASRELPLEMADSPLLRLAHQLYWEEQAITISSTRALGEVAHHSV